ncbi:titin-like [Dermacentor silvarum]|uniref:titin-like n=1 Tax=Dermacentor silvarum TaxID=543639 RepID=UPI0021008ADE|nr:titin-like [Dermacentor silvarum]
MNRPVVPVTSPSPLLLLLLLASLLAPSVPEALPSETTSVPKPQSLGFPPNLGLGDLAIASCFVKASTSPGQTLALRWDKDGRELVSDQRIEVHTTSASGGIMLSIRNLQPDDVGNYTCTVRSPGGSRGVTVPLVVTGKPRRKHIEL